MGHELATIAPGNYVAFTFFIGTMAMMAASVFFFFGVKYHAHSLENIRSRFWNHHIHRGCALLLHARLQLGNRCFTDVLPLC